MYLITDEKIQERVSTCIPDVFSWVYLGGILLILDALSLIFKKTIQFTGLMWDGLMLIFVLIIHIPLVLAGNKNRIELILKVLPHWQLYLISKTFTQYHQENLFLIMDYQTQLSNDAN